MVTRVRLLTAGSRTSRCGAAPMSCRASWRSWHGFRRLRCRRWRKCSPKTGPAAGRQRWSRSRRTGRVRACRKRWQTGDARGSRALCSRWTPPRSGPVGRVCRTLAAGPSVTSGPARRQPDGFAGRKRKWLSRITHCGPNAAEDAAKKTHRACRCTLAGFVITLCGILAANAALTNAGLWLDDRQR